MPIEGVFDGLRAARDSHAEAWDVLRHVQCAQFDEEVFRRLAASFEDRFRVLRLLARGYLPTETSGKLWDYLGDDLPSAPVSVAAEDEQISERALEEHLEQRW